MVVLRILSSSLTLSILLSNEKKQKNPANNSSSQRVGGRLKPRQRNDEKKKKKKKKKKKAVEGQHTTNELFRPPDMGSIPVFVVDLFPGRVIPLTLELLLQWLPLILFFFLFLFFRLAASLAKWLRRPPQELKIPGPIPACVVGLFLDRVIPVTSK